MNIAIIVITYNRPDSLKRILDSINHAVYPPQNIPLIISIDYSNSMNHDNVVDIANRFEWKYGSKEVINHQSNLGLKKHIITCGNLSDQYDAIIMLEDDIFVSPQYYNYAEQMLIKYKSESYISGISLYKHEKNPNISQPFSPIKNQYDVFFIQYAQSWGQCWSKEMWSSFYCWYETHQEWDPTDLRIPSFVRNWPASSWLKYFIKYTILTDKYFVYPYTSLSTNFGDSGTHNQQSNNSFQVNLNISHNLYRTPDFEQAIIYDSFFEIKSISIFDNIDDKNICIDLYNTKNNLDNKKFWLTTKILPFKIISSYGLDIKPIELNILLDNKGTEIYLYDTTKKAKKAKKAKKGFEYYNYPDITLNNIANIIKYKIRQKINKLKQ